MELHFELNQQLIKDFASYIDLQDIKKYTKDYKEDLQENTKDKNSTNNNSIWTLYIDDTICKAKIDTTKKIGGI